MLLFDFSHTFSFFFSSISGLNFPDFLKILIFLLFEIFYFFLRKFFAVKTLYLNNFFLIISAWFVILGISRLTTSHINIMIRGFCFLFLVLWFFPILLFFNILLYFIRFNFQFFVFSYFLIFFSGFLSSVTGLNLCYFLLITLSHLLSFLLGLLLFSEHSLYLSNFLLIIVFEIFKFFRLRLSITFMVFQCFGFLIWLFFHFFLGLQLLYFFPFFLPSKNRLNFNSNAFHCFIANYINVFILLLWRNIFKLFFWILLWIRIFLKHLHFNLLLRCVLLIRNFIWATFLFFGFLLSHSLS